MWFKKNGEVRILWIYCWQNDDDEEICIYKKNTKIINQSKMVWSNFRPFLLDVY
jgi:hypothetical protein